MTHTVVCYFPTGKRRARKVCEAFAVGARGGYTDAAAELLDGPAFFYGVHPATQGLFWSARSDGRPWFYADNGYFGRGEYFRVTRGALQHDGQGVPDFGRLDRLGLRIHPWRCGGGHILVAPPGDVWWQLTRQPGTAAGWLAEVRAQLEAVTDRPIRVRRKPARGDRGPSLEADLVGAWALVTHASNTALEAIMAGVPAFVTGGCAARLMAGADLADIERPRRPAGRRHLAGVLAANQWTLRELRDGAAWRALRG